MLHSAHWSRDMKTSDVIRMTRKQKRFISPCDVACMCALQSVDWFFVVSTYWYMYAFLACWAFAGPLLLPFQTTAIKFDMSFQRLSCVRSVYRVFRVPAAFFCDSIISTLLIVISNFSVFLFCFNPTIFTMYQWRLLYFIDRRRATHFHFIDSEPTGDNALAAQC